MLAIQANLAIPDGCRDPNHDGDEDPLGITFVLSPGSPLFNNRRQSAKFIAFLYANQDGGHQVSWSEMTGREQYEWFEAWERSGRSHARMEQETRGLRGTDIFTRITTRQELDAALGVSPSLSRRAPDAQANHQVAANEWDEAVRTIRF